MTQIPFSQQTPLHSIQRGFIMGIKNASHNAISLRLIANLSGESKISLRSAFLSSDKLYFISFTISVVFSRNNSDTFSVNPYIGEV